MSSSSMASTKPAILNRPESNGRRKQQRSSSWSAWATAPLVPKGGSMSSKQRSSSVGRPVNRDIAALSGKQKAAGKRGSFRRWGKRREKKSVTFDDDLDSAGTVRRQKGPAPVLISGIIPQANPEEIQSHDKGAFMHKHTADEPSPLPGSWVDAPDTTQDLTNSKYWSGIRQELEADAKFREQRSQRRVSQTNRNEPRMHEHGSSHQRTVSRDDHLTARGANPRTGVVSPSLMSGSANSGSRDSQEDTATIQKWRLKGNQWVSLDPNEKTPLPTPEAKETAEPVFSNKHGSQTAPRSPSSPLAKSHLSELEDRFVVNMPSAKEPSPLTMTTQQIIDFQKAIERVQREGGTMVDPETVPTPRSVTPEGLSTPPTKLRKRLKNKLRGRKRSVTSPVSPGSDKQDTNRDNGHSAVVPPNNLATHVESCYSDDLPPIPTSRSSCGKSNGDNVGAVPSLPSHNTQNARQEPFLGQGAGSEDPFYPNKTSEPNAEILSRYPSLPWMNASHLSMEEYEMFLQTLPKELAIHEELLRQNQSRHSLTAPEVFPGNQTPEAHLHTITTTSPRQNEHTQSDPTHLQRPLNCGPHRHENQSTTTITMTPMSTPINTTIPIDLPIDLPVAIPCHHKPGPDSSLQGPVYHPFGTCGTQQQYHSRFHASNKDAEPRKVGLNKDISTGMGKSVPTVRANTHGSIPMKGSPSRAGEMRLPPDCDQRIQHRISKSSPDTSKLDSSPIGFQSTSISLGGTWPRGGPSIHREMDGPKKLMELNSENTRSVEAERPSELITAENGNQDMKAVPIHNPVGDQGGLSFSDALIVVIQLIFGAFRDHQTIRGLRQIITHLLTMSSHCLKVTLNLCDYCHEFSKTGVLPRLPRNLNETGRLLIDGGRAGVYLFIMAVVATVLGRVLGLLAVGVGWLAWIMKFWGWI
ncbi:hypothetical protein FQN50_008248 [Emmonsiellopsis sp. PD_5]|nr:hypothetical protein FQN50_008248 [Emmonsiellopsis sp. PD_5]